MNFFLLALVFCCCLTIPSCGSEPSSSVSAHTTKEQLSPKYEFTSIIDNVMLGSQYDEIIGFMHLTAFKQTGERDGKINFMGEDENEVIHAVVFSCADDGHLTAYIYKVQFDENNESLVMNYQKKMRNQLELLFGSDFRSGYNNSGDYVIQWTMENIEASLITGMSHIILEINSRQF